MTNEEFAKTLKQKINEAIDITVELVKNTELQKEQITVDKATVERAKAFFNFDKNIKFEEETIEE